MALPEQTSVQLPLLKTLSDSGGNFQFLKLLRVGRSDDKVWIRRLEDACSP